MNNDLQNAQQVKQGRSWKFYALIASGVAALLICGTFVALYFYRQSLIHEYTSDTPAQLQFMDISRDDRKALQGKWSHFYEEIRKGGPTAPLTMSPKELNSFISMIPEVSDNTLLSIEENRIRVDYAVPLDALGLNGRYANGVALLEISLGEDHLPKLELISLKLNGKPPPDSILSRLDTGGLDKVGRILADATIWKDLESIDIRDGMLVFSPKNLK